MRTCFAQRTGKPYILSKVSKPLTPTKISELPSYDLVVPALHDVGLDGIKEKCRMQPGVPLKPMLAKPTKAIGEVLDRCEGKKFTCEFKYDGERAQVSVLASLYDASFDIYCIGSQAWGRFCGRLQQELGGHEQEVP